MLLELRHCAMPGLLLPAAREQCMRFCFVIFYLAPSTTPGAARGLLLSGMFPVLVFFASFRRVEWPGSSLSFLNRYLAMGPHAWHLGIKFLFRPCVAVWGLDWTCLLVFGIWSSVLRRLPGSDLLPLSLLMPLQFPFPLIPLLQTCSWAGVPSETLQILAGQTLYSPRKLSIL